MGVSVLPAATGFTTLFSRLVANTAEPENDQAPSDTGGGTEVTGGSYARVTIAANTTNFDNTQNANTTAVSSGATGTTRNSVVVTFPAPTANWGVVTHFGVYDASSTSMSITPTGSATGRTLPTRSLSSRNPASPSWGRHSSATSSKSSSLAARTASSTRSRCG